MSQEKPRALRWEAAEARAAAGYPIKQRSVKNHTHSSHILIENDMASAPGSHFHLFGGLPSELRLKIFGFAAYEGRIIELERPDTLEKFINQSFEDTWHASVQVCQESKKAPALLHACRHSRFEALLHYKLANFSTELNTPVYFNPIVDIIFFNETMCPGSMVYVSRLGLDIRHVAVPCKFTYDNCPVHGCHECEDEGLWLSWAGGLTHLQALHGVSTAPGDDSLNIPGFNTLEEITFVVSSNLWRDDMGIYSGRKLGQKNGRVPLRAENIPGEWLQSLGGINGVVTFRPAISEGHTLEEIRETHKIKEMIRNLKSGIDLPDVGDQRWLIEALPIFTFRSFAPRIIGYSDSCYDAVAIPSHHVLRLRKNHSKYIEDLETSLNCKITVCSQIKSSELYCELGLCGTKEFVAQAKGAILNILNIKPGKQYNEHKRTAEEIRDVGGLEFY